MRQEGVKLIVGDGAGACSSLHALLADPEVGDESFFKLLRCRFRRSVHRRSKIAEFFVSRASDGMRLTPFGSSFTKPLYSIRLDLSRTELRCQHVAELILHVSVVRVLDDLCRCRFVVATLCVFADEVLKVILHEFINGDPLHEIPRTRFLFAQEPLLFLFSFLESFPPVVRAGGKIDGPAPDRKFCADAVPVPVQTGSQRQPIFTENFLAHVRCNPRPELPFLPSRCKE